MAKRGYVYCIANDMMPGVVKIGATARDPEERLSDARATTWAPSCFRLVAQAAVDDAFAAEHAVHTLLAARRVEARREFFALTHDEARVVFDAVALGATAPSALTAPAAPAPTAAFTAPTAPMAATAPTAATAEAKLRAWVEAHYEHVPRREKGRGTKLEAIYAAYTTAQPPVHARVLGKILFAKLLDSVYPGVGPHRGSDGSKGIFLLR
jgi:hypothetical protein